MGRIVVLGSSNTDLILQTERLPGPGETVLGGALLQAGGGKGANQAVAAARAGGRVIFLGAIGDDAFGQARRAELDSENINLTCLRTFPGQTSGVALIMVSGSGENVIGVAPGTNQLLTPADIGDLQDSLFQPGDVFVAQLETPPETVLAALRRAKASQLITILNPAPASRVVASPDWLGATDILVVNEHELAEIGGMATAGAEEALPLLKSLYEQGVSTIIVTLGSEGHMISTAEGLRAFPAFKVTAVDTVAAGDTFVGALAARLAERSTLPAACEWAGAAAALAVTRRGAQPSIPTRSDVDLFLARCRSQR